jgi:RsiW-degrading membrane proteinase PrsW (M82 family)
VNKLKNFTEGLLEEKDVVLYATSGMVTMLPNAMATQPSNDRPDGFVIHTVFLGKIPEKGTPWWMIMLAIILGLLILLLIIVALIKVYYCCRESVCCTARIINLNCRDVEKCEI